MRKLVLICASIAMSLPLPAQADPVQSPPTSGANADTINFCNEVIASGEFPELNFGECMSFNNTSINGFVSHICDEMRETGTLEDNGFSSYSDCIRNLVP